MIFLTQDCLSITLSIWSLECLLVFLQFYESSGNFRKPFGRLLFKDSGKMNWMLANLDVGLTPTMEIHWLLLAWFICADCT